MPPNISHRLAKGGAFSWYELMEEVEGAMVVLSKVASTVVEKNWDGNGCAA